MSEKLVILTCIVMTLGVVSAPAVLADIIIRADESCRTNILDLDTNNHSSSKLSIRSDEKSAKSWIKFDLGELDVSNLETAILIVALHDPKDGDRHFDVSYVNDNCLDNIDWDERSLTWNNAPGNNTADFGGLDTSKTILLTTVNFTNGVPGDSFTIDVLEALEADTDGIVQFVFHNSNGLLNLATHDHAEEAWRPFIDVTQGSKNQARKPYPASGATDTVLTPILSWTPGEYGEGLSPMHKVFFSESFSDVNDGVNGVTMSTNSYAPGRLAFETTYYWRVDEVNAPPDSTVYLGAVWSFTTEPMGYPIDGANITATASSSGEATFGPENTINGSGLDENDLHSVTGTDMWLSDNEMQGAWIQYEFDKLYKLSEMWAWNSNQVIEQFFGLGIKDVSVEYSTDGVEWTTLVDVPEFTQAPGAVGYAHDTTVNFGGAVAQYIRLTASSNWGGLLPQYSLSEVRFFSIPVSAREPSPDSGAADVNPAVALAWRAGRDAVTHNVYLSADQQAVIDGTVPAVNVADTSYSTAVDLSNTYYWRVDEINEAETPTSWPGDVWNFSTSDYLVVDDFESYNDIDPPDPGSHRIFESWIDGYNVPTNGALVGYDPPQPSYAETAIVHDGRQSMPLFYSNTGGATSSETTHTFAIGQDWTKYGVQTLSLWFYGTEGNTGQLYAKISGVKVPYNGDAANLAVTGWLRWDIDLTTVGVNLQSVTSLTIGIDDNAAIGTLYFDDIRLY